MLTLYGSEDHRFVNVEDYGVVSSYSPRLSSGDHQTMVYVKFFLFQSSINKYKSREKPSNFEI